MRVRCKVVAAGVGPEKVVAITTLDGREEEVIVHPRLIEGDTIEVGRVHRCNGKVLIELPQESASGNWRLWVPAASVAA